MKRNTLIIIILLVLLIPLWSYLTWLLWPSRVCNLIVLDKAVSASEGTERAAINWILDQQKYQNSDGRSYDLARNGVGYFSKEAENFPAYSSMFIDSLATNLNMVYYTEARGVAVDANTDEQKSVPAFYEGDEYQLLEKMYRRRKMIIAEYSALQKHTQEVKEKMEAVFQVDQSGWQGRYFPSLDTTGTDIPRNLIRMYREYTQQPFDFGEVPGIILKHTSGIVLVLKDGEHLDLPAPIINTGAVFQEAYGLPPFIPFLRWFDITFSKEEENVLAYYKLHTSKKGDSLLSQYGLPTRFPAVIGDAGESLRYYFCGNFSYNEVSGSLRYFKGLPWLMKAYYNFAKPMDSEDRFFWTYYYPLMENLLRESSENISSLDERRALPEASDYIPYSLEAGSITLLPREGSSGIHEREGLLEEVKSGSERHREPAGRQLETDQVSAEEKTSYSFNREDYEVGGRMPYEIWMAIKEGRRPNDYRRKQSSGSKSLDIDSSDNKDVKMWYIVIASLRSLEEARDYAEKTGDPEVRIIYAKQVNSNRVIVGQYQDLREAQLHFEEVVRHYPDAWMVLF